MSKKVITGRDGKYPIVPKVPENDALVIVQKSKDKREKGSPWFSH